MEQSGKPRVLNRRYNRATSWAERWALFEAYRSAPACRRRLVRQRLGLERKDLFEASPALRLEVAALVWAHLNLAFSASELAVMHSDQAVVAFLSEIAFAEKPAAPF
jgi:hypothetical protein